MNEYEMICRFEELKLESRFLPYAYGSKKKTLTYSGQSERANFIFFSDSHIDFSNPNESFDNVKQVFDYANRSTVKFDALIHTGDIITPFGIKDKHSSYENARRFFDLAKACRSPLIFSKGNHDLNDWDNLPENVFTDDDWGSMYLDFAEESFGIKRQEKKCGSKSTWHYYDVESKKIRIISIDALDSDKKTVNENGTVKFHGGRSFYVSNEQINWFASTALNFDDKSDKNWGVIVAFHHDGGSTKPPHENAVSKLMKICAAFNTQSTYENEYKNDEFPFFDMSVSADFSRYGELDEKPHMICILMGHDHVDRERVRDGINVIYTLNNSASTDYSDDRVVRIPGTATQNSFDILNIDTTHREIRVFRYGAGVNCYGVGGDRFLPDGLKY